MSEESVQEMFDALYRLIDMRQIFRKTSPNHELNEDQEEEMKQIIDDVKGNLEKIEEEML